jgi:hypothetical protein
MAKRRQTFDRARRKRKAQQRLKAAVRQEKQAEQEAVSFDGEAPAGEDHAAEEAGQAADE